METRVLNVVIVDDEKEACANLEHILHEYIGASVKVLGTANNTREAAKLISSLQPDAVFLDIEMPNENAFHFLDRIGPVNFEVVFVTAYDEYAVKAFKTSAVDYILKPISINELMGAVKKIHEKISVKSLLHGGVSYSELSNNVKNRLKSHKITLRDSNVIEVVDFKDIYFVEAQGSYIRVVFLKDTAAKEIVMSGSLTDYEELLPSESFFRIHKSYVINCQHVARIIRDENSQVMIRGNFTLPVSRRRYAPMMEFLKSNNYYNE